MHTTSFSASKLACGLLAAGAAFSLPAPVAAQSGSTDFRLEEVIVTARRREESLQTVPISINAVSGDMIEELNIQSFEDMEAIIPGLTLESSAISGTASLRGVRFDSFASLSGTVEFYLNDASTVNTAVLQSMYDISQVEVLRGPQGTLRGKASPSGSITLSTRSPDLDRVGGEVNANGDDAGGRRIWGALNLPLWEDKLAVRVAGLFDKNPANQAESVNSDVDPENKTESQRISATFAPVDSLNIDFVYQKLDADIRSFQQVESASIANPSLPTNREYIRASDRKAVTDIPGTTAEQKFDIYNLRADWTLGDHTLYYVGQYVEYLSSRKQADDSGDFFGPDYPNPDFDSFGQDLVSLDSEGQAQELRLQSDEPLFDRFDYVLGAFYSKGETTNDLITQTPVTVGSGPDATVDDVFSLIVDTPIAINSTAEETSFFGHLTWHLGDATELSAGARFIKFEINSVLALNGNIVDIATTDDKDDTWVYTASLKHEFNEDLMGYASIGTSWRPGNNVIGDFNEQRSELENSFLVLPPEESTSYEIGLKSTWLDGTLRINTALFYQEFEDYPYRVPNGVYYVSTSNGVDTVSAFNFVGPVPLNVHGLELEGYWQTSDNWYVSGTVAYAKSEVDNGFIPCNDYFPADGIPDSSGQIPSVDDIRSRTNGDNLTGCTVDGLGVNFAPEWSGTVQSEYSFPIQEYDIFFRGQASLYGDSKNDETNPLDDVDAYGILNLYTGIRDAEGHWEIMLYGSNITDTERVLNRGDAPASIGYQRVDLTQGTSAVGATGVSDYRAISMTAPREFGINLRYSF